MQKGQRSRVYITRGYVLIWTPNHPRRSNKGYMYEHTLIAEKALGHFLPPRAVVHHVDGDGTNNSNRNLVICENQSYHKLLHVREEGHRATGNPEARKCMYCKQYTDIKTLVRVNSTRTYYHKKCHAAFRKNQRHAKGASYVLGRPKASQPYR